MIIYYTENDVQNDSGLVEFAAQILKDGALANYPQYRDPNKPTNKEVANVLNSYANQTGRTTL